MPRVGFKELAALTQVIARGRLLRYRGGEGGFVARFENELKDKLGTKHVLAVNSGTSALISALVGAGIGPGDEVLVPAYGWIASAAAPLAVGAVPILVDIDESLMIDPEDIKRKITPYTRAIIPVHMLNLVADMDAIMAIAKQNRLVVIEDACQAVGGSYKGRRVGTIGDAGAFSFNQFKNVNAGEGGAIMTNNDRIFTRARMYHDVGSYTREYEFEGNEPVFAGVNFRISELTGAVLHAQLSKLDPYLRRLRKRHTVMHAALSRSRKGRVSPHNDLTSAAGLSMTFDSAEEARHFARFAGVEHLIETGRHLYTNWAPLLTQRTFDERMNPYRWAKRPIDYSADMCRTTIDILQRTCRVSLGAQYPLSCMRVRSKILLNSLK